MNFAISYSGGKNSVLALHRMLEQGHNPVAMITTVNIEQRRSWFHGIQNELLDAVSKSLDIPLIICECTPDNYTQAYEQSLAKSMKMGADSCVFGDIDIDAHKTWDEERCKNVGIKCILPLWQQGREALVRELLTKGFKSIIKIEDSNKLDGSFLGQTLTMPLIEKMKAVGVDPCGENGEYHTFVYDGPIFAYPISFETDRIIDFGTHKAIDIICCEA
jgi:uncharacterized protein (TIGR00290 family)